MVSEQCLLPQFLLQQFLLPKSFEFLSLFSPSFFVEICLIASLKLRLFACAYLAGCEAAYEAARLMPPMRLTYEASS